MENEKICVGIVGLGRIADVHFLGYIENKSAQIYAVCDIDEKLVEKRKKEWNVEKGYTNYLDMLDDPKISAVEILTPHHLHEQMVLEACKRKKHIALQKPMTTDIKSANRILKAVQKQGIVFKITENYCFYPPIQYVKKMIEEGCIGTASNLRIKFISGNGGWEVPSSSWEWRVKERELGRGMQTFDHGHHLWSTAWFLLGDIEKVVSWIDSSDGIVDCPATIMWKYKEKKVYGMAEYVHASEMNIPSQYYGNDEWIEVTGSKGIIVLHRCTGNIYTGPIISYFNGNKWEEINHIEDDWATGFVGATQNFIDAIQHPEKKEVLLSGEQAKNILKINIAISKSSKIGREVYVEEGEKCFPYFYKLQQSWKEKNNSPKRKVQHCKKNIKDYISQAKMLTIDRLTHYTKNDLGTGECTFGFVLQTENEYEEQKFTITIKNQEIHYTEGEVLENCIFIVYVRPSVWGAILSGHKRVEMAFIQGNIKIQGKVETAIQLRKVFKI